MTSKIKIMSQAAVSLGGDPIQSETITGTEADPWEVTVMNSFYDLVKESELGEHIWQFATKTTELTKLTAAPENVKWDYQYDMPPDLRLDINLMDKTSGSQIAYEPAGDKILTDISTGVKLEYVYDIDESLFPGWFQKVMISKLAAMAAISMTDSPTKKRVFDDDYAVAVFRAKLADANGTPPTSLIDESTSTYIAARYS